MPLNTPGRILTVAALRNDMPPRPHRLRWLLSGCLAVAGFLTVLRGQLQPAPAPESAPASPAPASSPAGDAAKSPALVAEPAAPPPAVDPAALTLAVRAELERAQRERVAEIQSSIRAAQRTSDELAARLALMEQNAARQREHDSAYMRDFTRLALFVGGGLGGLAVISLGVIIWLQNRAARQQAVALADHARVLATLPQLLPGPAPSQTPAHPTIVSAQTRFHGAVDRLKQQLDEIESLAQPAETKTPGESAPVAPAARTLSLVPDVPASAEPVREDAVALIEKGHALIQEGQPAPALAYLERATVLDPSNVQAWLKRGVALEKLERLRDALLAYDTAAAIEPNLPVVHLSRAGVLNRLQRYDDALRCYEQALAVQGRDGKPSATAAA